MKKLKSRILSLIEIARLLKLNDRDINVSLEYMEYNEQGLAFDQIITQMHEYDIEIGNDVYALIQDIADMMQLPAKDYYFMRELIRSENEIPKPVMDEIGKIIASLK
ncbi:hypothetical protein SAMN05216464_10914 [Mucilaginibacter pineti]|uniref:MafI family immunity protein n=1 Tax=Mucilaginibacter pineti TaxID=1391627 RepID=A0A1G7FE10_9SPHI|nr:MafI family immunity protein [Mucilaginibacter pineti]SDE74094.1 hypothetical protein SAMN05216464_10914 [Mucilaginibacter pineti]